jgi:hypothetical protein
MQTGYHSVDGWLGFIIGDKIFVDFTKYSLDDSLKKLKTQIELNVYKKEEISKQELNASIPVLTVEKMSFNNNNNNNNNKAIDWTNDQVEKWFMEKNLPDVYNELKPIDGKLLHQLNQFQKFTPEFFYKSIAYDHLSVVSVAKFASFLQELFDN